MKKLYVLFALLIVSPCFGQPGRKLATFLSLQGNRTLYDRTITNNSAGPGGGIQTYLNTKGLVKPILEIHADLFTGTKELYTTLAGAPVEAKERVLSTYIGLSARPGARFFIATTAGTSFFNNQAHFGIRPSVGFYPSKSESWMAKGSFTTIFQQDDISSKSFGYLSLALAVRVF